MDTYSPTRNSETVPSFTHFPFSLLKYQIEKRLLHEVGASVGYLVGDASATVVWQIVGALVEVTETDEPQPTVLLVAALADDGGVVDTFITEEPQLDAALVDSTLLVLADGSCDRAWEVPTQTISGLSSTSAGAPQLAFNLRPPGAECQPSPVDHPSSEATSDVDPLKPLFPPFPPFTPTLETVEEPAPDAPGFPLPATDEEVPSIA